MSDKVSGVTPPRSHGEVLFSIEQMCATIAYNQGATVASIQKIADKRTPDEVEKMLCSIEQLCTTIVKVTCEQPDREPIELVTKSKLIEFKDLTKVAASAKVGSTIDGETFGCRNFICYARCDRDSIISFEIGESTADWYPLEDREHSDVKPEHDNGTVGTSAVEITPTGKLQSVLIHNTHAANVLSVSFDDGDTWTAIDPDQSLSMPCDAYSYQLKGSAAGTNYEAIHVYYLMGWKVKGGVKKVFEFSAPAARYIRAVVENLSTTEVLSAEISVKAIN